LAAASLSVGVASTFRWDFGIYGALSLVLATWLAGASRPDTGPATRASSPRLLRQSRSALPSMRSSWGVMPRNGSTKRPVFMAREFSDWRNYEFLRAAVDSLERGCVTGHLHARRQGVMYIAFAITPFVVLPVAAWRSMRIALRRIRRSSGNSASPCCFRSAALFLLLQMRVRPGLPQGLPAFTCALMLLPTIRPVRDGPGTRSMPLRSPGWRCCASPASRRSESYGLSVECDRLDARTGSPGARRPGGSNTPR
jgi:hypothetical protein